MSLIGLETKYITTDLPLTLKFNPVCSLKGVSFGSKNYKKELKPSSVQVFRARLVSFG